MNNEDFVTFDQAVKLKELGFDWGCQAYFEDYVDELNRHHRKFRFNAVANDMLYKDFCSAPTLAQAQKWLREVKGLDVIVRRIGDEGYDYVLFYPYPVEPFICPGISSAYEQALSAGINKALKMIKR